MKTNHRKVGLISTMSPDETWAKNVLDRVAASHGVIKRKLEEMGFEVLDEGPLRRSYIIASANSPSRYWCTDSCEEPLK